MNRLFLISLGVFFLQMSLGADLVSKGKEKILIKKYFTNRHTYVIICKGFPKRGSMGNQRIITAKEAALLNAQYIASRTFKKSIDVFKNGHIIKYRLQRDYAIIYFKLKKWNLRYHLKT